MKKGLLCAIITVGIAFCLSGCVSVKSEDLTSAIKANNSKRAISLIKKYNKETGNTDELDKIVVKDVRDLYHSDKYSDIETAEKITRGVKGTSVYHSLTDIQKANGEHKMIAFLQSSKWIRRDLTDYDGLEIKVVFNHKQGTAIVTSNKNSSDKSMKVHNLKWKNIKYLGDNVFQYKDLSKSDDGSYAGYETSSGEIDYSKHLIITYSNSNDNDYGLGDIQAWYAKSQLQRTLKKKVSDQEDSVYYVNQKIRKFNKSEAFVTYGTDYPVKDKNGDGKKAITYTSRKITVGDSYNDVVNKYGIGHRVPVMGKQNCLVNSVTENLQAQTKKDKIKEIKSGLHYVKSIDYYLIYPVKDKSEAMCFGFTKDNMLVCIIWNFPLDQYSSLVG
jgi:hypothetical protein